MFKPVNIKNKQYVHCMGELKKDEVLSFSIFGEVLCAVAILLCILAWGFGGSVVYTRKNTQLVFSCWQAWTWLSWPILIWLSWPAWIVLLKGLFMNVGSDYSWLDERTDLNSLVGTIMKNQQPCSCMIEHAVKEWWNNKVEQRCYHNHELGCCIKSGFACSNIREQWPLSIRQLYTICWNMIEQYCYFIPILFYHVNSVVTFYIMHCFIK